MSDTRTVTDQPRHECDDTCRNLPHEVAAEAPRPPGPYDDELVRAAWAAGEAWGRLELERERLDQLAEEADAAVERIFRGRQLDAYAARESTGDVPTEPTGPRQRGGSFDAVVDSFLEHGDRGRLRDELGLDAAEPEDTAAPAGDIDAPRVDVDGDLEAGTINVTVTLPGAMLDEASLARRIGVAVEHAMRRVARTEAERAARG